MEHKNLIATIYLKNGMAVKGKNNPEIAGDLRELAKLYNDSGVDKLYIFDLSANDAEHEVNLHTMKELSRIVEIPIYGAGCISRLEDIKKLIYAGCKGIILDSGKHETISLAEEGAKRFGRDKILVSMENVDLIFKHKKEVAEHIHKLVVLQFDDIAVLLRNNTGHSAQFTRLIRQKHRCRKDPVSED